MGFFRKRLNSEQIAALIASLATRTVMDMVESGELARASDQKHAVRATYAYLALVGKNTAGEFYDQHHAREVALFLDDFLMHGMMLLLGYDKRSLDFATINAERMEYDTTYQSGARDYMQAMQEVRVSEDRGQAAFRLGKLAVEHVLDPEFTEDSSLISSFSQAGMLLAGSIRETLSNVVIR